MDFLLSLAIPVLAGIEIGINYPITCLFKHAKHKRKGTTLSMPDTSAGISPFSHFLTYYLYSELQMRQSGNCLATAPKFAGVAACELIGFYSAIYDLTNQQEPSTLAQVREWLLKVFPQQSLIYTIFSPTRSESESLALSAVLICLSTLVWDLCNFSGNAAIELYFNRLSMSILHQGLLSTLNRTVLLWTLMTDMDSLTLQCPERLWLISHCLSTFGQLSSDFVDQSQVALLEFLFGAGNPGPDRYLSWKPEDLAQALWQGEFS